MQKQLSDIPVSVLDLATIVEEETASDAFKRSLALARQAERRATIVTGLPSITTWKVWPHRQQQF